MTSSDHIFLVDNSKSMSVVHDKKMISDCITHIISELKQDPYSIESVKISIVVYNEIASYILKEIELFEINECPHFECENKSNLNSGIQFLKNLLQHEKYISTRDKKPKKRRGMLSIFTGIKPNPELKSDDIEFINKNFSLGPGPEASIMLDETVSSVGQILVSTSKNKYVTNYFKQYFEIVKCYESPIEFWDAYRKYWYQ